MVRILICDERPLISNALQEMLAVEPDFDIVGIADSGVHVMMLIRSLRPDVVVIGQQLRGMSGADLIRKIRSDSTELPGPPVVLYPVEDSDATLADALQAGADGLLADDASAEEFVLAIRAVVSGWFRSTEEPAPDSDPPLADQVTSREREVLVLAARGLSTAEIAAELFIAVATVRTHLYRVQTKLGLRDRAALVSFAYRAGLMRES